MNPAYVWLKEHSELKSQAVKTFDVDSRRSAEDNIADSIASSPTLLPDIMKLLVYEAIKQDAADETVDDLLAITRRMNTGIKKLAESAHNLDILKRFRGVRTDEQINGVLMAAAIEQPLSLRGTSSRGHRRHLSKERPLKRCSRVRRRAGQNNVSYAVALEDS